MSSNRVAIDSREGMKRAYRAHITSKIFFVLFLLLSVIVCAGVSLTLGERGLTFLEVYRILFEHISGTTHQMGTDAWWDDFIVWNVRLPRILVAILAGSGLAVCGAVMQSMVKNPLADPYTTGISAGAILGVSVAIALGFSIVKGGSLGVILNAFIFGMIPAAVIILISRISKMGPATIILAGIAMTYFFSALSTLIMLTSSAETIHTVYLWQIGSLNNMQWSSVNMMAPLVILGSVVSFLLSKKLNVLSLGESSAKSLGLDADGLRSLCLIIVSFTAAAVVSFVGVIGFLGLVAPNMVRYVLGSDNKYLIPASILSGSAILLFADTISRLITTPEIPVGIVMSFIGGPVFLLVILLSRNRVW